MNVNKNCNDLPALPLVEEVKYRMYLNDIYYSDFYCTPDSIEELAIGNLYINSNIHSLGDIERISINGYKINVYTTEGLSESASESFASSFILPEISKLQEFAKMMFSSAKIYTLYGGIHCSALSDGSDLVDFKEDVGRHNAFDKVVGAALLKGYELSSLIYLTSGRVNNEVMAKAVSCRLPLIVSRSIMTSAAYESSKQNGVRVVGRILSSEPVNYEGSGSQCLKR